MAMTAEELSAGEDRLDEAGRSLRAHTELRWVEVANHVLERVLRANRPSYPVAGRTATGESFHVSENVLTASLLRALDVIPHCEVMGIRLHVERDAYTGVMIALKARYAHPLIPMADAVRRVAERHLREVLGDVIPMVSVTTMHVHVADVTDHDPKLE